MINRARLFLLKVLNKSFNAETTENYWFSLQIASF
jgi:hypothetical protein